MGSRVGNATGLVQLSHFLYSELHPRAAATHWNATHTPAGKAATPGSGSVLSLLALGSEEIPSDSTAHLPGIAASCTVASGEEL